MTSDQVVTFLDKVGDLDELCADMNVHYMGDELDEQDAVEHTVLREICKHDKDMNGQLPTWICSRMLYELLRDATRSEACKAVIGWIEDHM